MEEILPTKIKASSDEINEYINKLQKKTKNVFIFNTYFFDKLRNAYSNENKQIIQNEEKEKEEEKHKIEIFQQLSKWFRKSNFIYYDFLFVPIFVDDHWSLLLFSFHIYNINNLNQLNINFNINEKEKQERRKYEKIKYEKEIKEKEEEKWKEIRKETEEFHKKISKEKNEIIKEIQQCENGKEMKKIEKKYKEIKKEYQKLYNKINGNDYSHYKYISFEKYSPCCFTLDSLKNEELNSIFRKYYLLCCEYFEWYYQQNNIPFIFQKLPVFSLEVEGQKSDWECGYYMLNYIRIFIDYQPKNIFEYERKLIDKNEIEITMNSYLNDLN